MTRNTKRLTGLKKTLLLALAAIPMSAIIVAGGTMSVRASPDVMEQVHHYIECFGWMITDPETHVANCAPGHIPPYDPITNDPSGGGRVTTTRTVTTTQL